jgi:hypothetical protein
VIYQAVSGVYLYLSVQSFSYFSFHIVLLTEIKFIRMVCQKMMHQVIYKAVKNISHISTVSSCCCCCFTFCLVGRDRICMHQKRMDTSDLPTSVADVLYHSIQNFDSRSLQEFHNKFSHSPFCTCRS